MNTKKAVKKIYKLITKRRPKAHYIISKNKFLSFLQTLIPNKLLDFVFLEVFKMDYGNSK